ncbi:MAG: hypothetical protein IPM89_08035 [Candidatus Competibacteraceae bacterium]|nr:MAG: hypothetical protein IPM89_08035 [Candidatus Competibacteraceae bacterium]
MITQRQLTDIARLTADQGLDHATASRLRQVYPGTYFTYCLDDDINGMEPALESAGFNLYLVDGSQHCLRLTSDLQVATGIVLAAVLEETN